MDANKNLLIAFLFVALLAAGLAVYRVTAIEPLEPPPARALQPDGAPTAPSTALTQQATQGRDAVPTTGGSTDEPESSVSAGRVRGQVDVAPGESFPVHFELLIESPPAAARVLAFGGSERLVTLDLPIGRSLIRARAEGLASRGLVLSRDLETPLQPFRLVLEPAGRLGGQVLDARGAPLAGLPVALVSTLVHDARTVASDVEGRYEFVDVPAGAYRVAFGSSQSPIAPIVPVEVSRLETRDLPPQTMPDLGEGEILVLDRADRPVEGARVFGAGQRGGWIDAVSDRTGTARARFLPAGTFFLTATAEGGQQGQVQLEVDSGRIGRAIVQVRS